ncbi:MAG TPA: SDR family oxidoreductase [Pseudomonas sp.]|uniref:SDR family oxidoreductase n=1 Tax=Pseudomonas sp. TaxID=306 RepID=UPI002ED829CF
MELGLKGRRALVLGASRGLGAAIAKSLVAEGATVIAAARSTDLIKAWAAELGPEYAAQIIPLALDLNDFTSVDSAADWVIAQGGVDILVNNSGGPPAGSVLQQTATLWQTHFQAMAGHVFHLTNRLIDGMLGQRWGRIISIASSGVEQPIPNLGLSNGIRMAVLGWSKTLASEVAAQGVTVNVVLPGRIHTDRVDQLDQGAATRQHKSVEDIAAASRATIPVGRYGTPQEFANVVTFLASDAASYVTGSTIRVDGGMIRSV